MTDKAPRHWLIPPSGIPKSGPLCQMKACHNRATQEVRFPDTSPLIRLCDDCTDNYRSALYARDYDDDALDIRPLREL